jgi:tripartite ATP-independent transporter DctP family solute receptor
MMNRNAQRSVSRKRLLSQTLAAWSSIAVRPAGAADIVWKYASSNTADHPLNAPLIRAFSKIRRETKGAFSVQLFLNNALGDPVSQIFQLRSGALDMAPLDGGTLDGVVSVASIPAVAFVFKDHKTAFDAMDGDLGTVIRKEFPQYGFIAHERILENGFRYFTSGSKPIRTVDDLQGMKFRVPPGKLPLDTFRSLGVAVTTVSLGELYTALQTRLVDGQETPLASIESQRIYEVQKYCSLSRHSWTGAWLLIYRTKWDSLPSDIQGLFRGVVDREIVAERRSNVVLEDALQDKLQRQGLTFNPVDVAGFKAKLASSGYYGRWRTAYGEVAWGALEKYSGPLR